MDDLLLFAAAEALFCFAFAAGVYRYSPPTWRAWVVSWTRTEELETYTVDHAARDLVAHARQRGSSRALGVTVDYRAGRYSVTVGVTTIAGLTEPEATRAVSRALRSTE